MKFQGIDFHGLTGPFHSSRQSDIIKSNAFPKFLLCSTHTQSNIQWNPIKSNQMTSVPTELPATLNVDDGIATITLNRPEALNALTLPLVRQLLSFGREIEIREDIRVLVLRGNGHSFCVGADIQIFVENLDHIDVPVRQILNEMREFISCLKRMGKIVIMSVHGSVAGGGMSFVSHADLCIAAASTRFVPAYNRIGLCPDLGATLAYERSIGLKRSIQAFLFEDRISAQQALDWGIINWIVPDDQLIAETNRIAKRVAENALEAIAATKQLFVSSQAQTLEIQMTHEMETIISCMQGNTFKSAVTAFAKRTSAARRD